MKLVIARISLAIQLSGILRVFTLLNDMKSLYSDCSNWRGLYLERCKLAGKKVPQVDWPDGPLYQPWH